MSEKDFEPFGEEWQREMMQFTKPQLVELYKVACRDPLKVENDRLREALERYANKGMWEYTYSKRRGGSCGDIQCPNHVCTKSEFMSKYNGWEIAEKALENSK